MARVCSWMGIHVRGRGTSRSMLDEGAGAPLGRGGKGLSLATLGSGSPLPPSLEAFCSKKTSTLLHTHSAHVLWLWEGPMSQARVTCVAAGLNSSAPLLRLPGTRRPPSCPTPTQEPGQDVGGGPVGPGRAAA